MRPTQSAVIVPVNEAENAIGRFRAVLDRSAEWGVPAHVTVVYPFLPPELIDDRVVSALRRAVGSVPAFDVRFRRIAWFGDTVVWLAPDPDHPFRRLTAAVRERFPDYPPYEGAYADPIPHMTIGHDCPVELLRAAADAVRTELPIQAQITAAQLIQGSPDPRSWHPIAELPLAAT